MYSMNILSYPISFKKEIKELMIQKAKDNITDFPRYPIPNPQSPALFIFIKSINYFQF